MAVNAFRSAKILYYCDVAFDKAGSHLLSGLLQELPNLFTFLSSFYLSLHPEDSLLKM